MAVKTVLHGAISAVMLMALGTNSAHAGDLTILHINDRHSRLKPDGRMSLKLDGKSTRVHSGGMPAVVAKMKELQGLNAAGPYPTVVKGVGGKSVCVATARQYSQIVGELNISFKDAGEVQS